MQSSLTDVNGTSLGDALSLVERIDAVHGKIPGERGDHQFRMYVRLTPTAIDTLRRSNQFRRDSDNSIYHKGYPQSYREQGGTPSIQFSVAWTTGARTSMSTTNRRAFRSPCSTAT